MQQRHRYLPGLAQVQLQPAYPLARPSCKLDVLFPQVGRSRTYATLPLCAAWRCALLGTLYLEHFHLTTCRAAPRLPSMDTGWLLHPARQCFADMVRPAC